jgi:tRNA threonylcarbamoyladenosine biosynthesis protein TsaE
MEWVAATEEEMRELGKNWGRIAQPGWVIALVGGLGAGKTQWVKGFAEGMGYSGGVSSPTFGILHQYEGGRLPVFHYDFYRLETGEELVGTGWDEVLEANGVVIAEWGNLYEAWLPAGTRWLDFQTNADGSRRVTER